MSLDSKWKVLEEKQNLGGSLRIDEEDPNDFFCYLDDFGSRGLLLIIHDEFPKPPALASIRASVRKRSDGRCALLVVLAIPSLKEIFSLLCDDLIKSVRGMDKSSVGAAVIARIVRWHRLLESGGTGVLPLWRLRGLVGELIVLRDCLTRLPAPDAIAAWVGPEDAPQDFSFPTFRLEVKAILPSATRVPISSVDQLDTDSGFVLRLVVVSLSNVSSESHDGFSVSTLVSDIFNDLEPYPGASFEFRNRLLSGGYVESVAYELIRFRTESMVAYGITDDFPRLTRSMLPRGVADASYEVYLANCAPFVSPIWT